MVPGRGYRVAITPLKVQTTGGKGAPTVQACAVRLRLLAPGDQETAVKTVGCYGYFLYTPARGEGGVYSLETVVPAGTRGAQRYHLEVARATADDTAPGVFLGNHRRVRGSLDGDGVNRLDLYRFTVLRPSLLKLQLTGGAQLALFLRTDTGQSVSAPGLGRDAVLNVKPGRYYVAVTAPAGAAGRYTLARSTRLITSTSVVFGTGPRASARVGSSVPVRIGVRNATGGLARVTYERLDPIAGWQYVATRIARVRGVRAATTFVPRTVGRYRTRVEYLGTRDSAESASVNANLLVTD
ncbi:hypothetical protein DSM112329_01407 [Paraconexibacter sp. AEG42_29]|uniref:Peptidase C-terminal archaeal/bacterial domain-containing protein n=1 Tax=Paraconexibacter sp. AEG42_29 TaxID=2997339 RepID=A0AAU7ASE3_9ACTN